jgi:hypothetical protein
MSWTNEAVKEAQAIMQDTGSIFGDLAELQARKISDITIGKVFSLGRFEVLTATKTHDDPFVAFELGGVLYAGYARGIANQLQQMTKGAAKDPANKAFVTPRKCWTEIETNIPVVFAEKVSTAGKYRVMEVYEAPADTPATAPTEAK